MNLFENVTSPQTTNSNATLSESVFYGELTFLSVCFFFFTLEVKLNLQTIVDSVIF